MATSVGTSKSAMSSSDRLTHKTPLESNFMPLAVTQPKLYPSKSTKWMPCQRPLATQTPSITNCLVAVVHKIPVTAILVPKLVAMVTPFSTSGLPCNRWFLVPVRAQNHTASRSVQPLLQGSLVWQTDQQTTLLGHQQEAASTYAVLWCGHLHDAAHKHIKYIAPKTGCSKFINKQIRKTVSKTGEWTPPCRTPLRSINRRDVHIFHITVEVSLLYQFDSTSTMHFGKAALIKRINSL